MSDDGPNLILLEEFLEQRLRKEKEIEYYEEQMKEIERKLFFLRKERELTATIIDMLTREKVLDLQEMAEEKLLLSKKDDETT
jgi:hypothetical protein